MVQGFVGQRLVGGGSPTHRRRQGVLGVEGEGEVADDREVEVLHAAVAQAYVAPSPGGAELLAAGDESAVEIGQALDVRIAAGLGGRGT